MLYERKEVWTEETFDYQKVQIGDYVDQAVVDRKFAAQAPCFSYGVSGAVAGFH